MPVGYRNTADILPLGDAGFGNQGNAYTDSSALTYFTGSMERNLMHPATRQQLEYILTMLRDRGEKETFHYIKHSVLKGKPFPWDETHKED